MAQTLEESVARGVELLDAVRPGWRGEIQRVRLDMADGFHCILGQLYGDYGNGLDALWPMTEEIEHSEIPLIDLTCHHGFVIPEEVERRGIDAECDELWYELQELWLADIGSVGSE